MLYPPYETGLYRATYLLTIFDHCDDMFKHQCACIGGGFVDFVCLELFRAASRRFGSEMISAELCVRFTRLAVGYSAGCIFKEKPKLPLKLNLWHSLSKLVKRKEKHPQMYNSRWCSTL